MSNDIFKTYQETMIQLALEAREAKRKAQGNDRFLHRGFIVKVLKDLRLNRKLLVRR
jgi:hypothetical protein